MTEYIDSLDVIRNEAIGKDETYENNGVRNKDFSVLQVREMQGEMPIYNKHIAKFLEVKQTDAIQSCAGSSLIAKIDSRET